VTEKERKLLLNWLKARKELRAVKRKLTREIKHQKRMNAHLLWLCDERLKYWMETMR
jgi:hypothetical protein